jgi:excisionase family DNA binding protein
MTISEAAALLGIADATLARQARLGRIRATRHGPMWDIAPAAVEEYRTKVLGRKGPKGPRAKTAEEQP